MTSQIEKAAQVTQQNSIREYVNRVSRHNLFHSNAVLAKVLIDGKRVRQEVLWLEGAPVGVTSINGVPALVRHRFGAATNTLISEDELNRMTIGFRARILVAFMKVELQPLHRVFQKS